MKFPPCANTKQSHSSAEAKSVDNMWKINFTVKKLWGNQFNAVQQHELTRVNTRNNTILG